MSVTTEQAKFVLKSLPQHERKFLSSLPFCEAQIIVEALATFHGSRILTDETAQMYAREAEEAKAREE